MKKRLLLNAALTIVPVAMLFPHQAFASRCKSISVEEAYNEADVVFVGHSEPDERFYVLDKNYLLFAKDPGNGEVSLLGCGSVEDVGLENGYLATLLLDRINPNAVSVVGSRTIENSYIGAGMGLTDEEAVEFSKKRRMNPARQELLDELKRGEKS